MALLSLSLAAMNVLPLPALDGGRLVFIILNGLPAAPYTKNRTIYQPRRICVANRAWYIGFN